MFNRITQNMTSRNMLENITRANDKMTRTQEQLSSGTMLNRPSDDSASVIRAMQFKTELEDLNQYEKNISYAKTWVDLTDESLNSITNNIQRVRELVLQASNDTMTVVERKSIAFEIESLTEELKVVGNASVNGVYIFGGTQNTTPPYALGAVDTYNGNSGVITREVAPGVQTNINMTGNQVLGDATTGLLRNLRDIVSHLNSGTAADMNLVRGADLTTLDQNLDAISQTRAQVGGLQKRFEVSLGRVESLQVNTMKLLSQTQDTDIAKTYIKFSQEEAAFQAALRVGSKVVQQSLMDFLR